ncbi:hypothetical protein [Alicyclobacillus fastidiosus]
MAWHTHGLGRRPEMTRVPQRIHPVDLTRRMEAGNNGGYAEIILYLQKL